MPETRRSFFAAIGAVLVGLKLAKPKPEVWRTSMLRYAGNIQRNDWIDIYSLDDHPHLTMANRYAWMRHLRQHELAMKRVSRSRDIEGGRVHR